MTTQPRHYTGIYFLLRDGAVVYVGKTTRFPLRLTYHEQQHLPFDAVHFIQCEEDLLDEYERRWIRWFKPECNKTHKPAEKKKKIVRKIQIYRRRMKFRRLSRMSIIGFGKFRYYTVSKMIDLGKHLDLVNMYYKLSHISFLDDVLAEIGITSEWMIHKPGVHPEMYYAFGHEFHHEKMAQRRESATRAEYKKSLAALTAINVKDAHKSYHRKFNQK